MRLSVRVKGGKQFVNATSLIQQVCKLESEYHAECIWLNLARDKEDWKREAISVRLPDMSCFDGVSFPWAIKLLEHLGRHAKLTDEQRAGVVQAIRGRFTGDMRLLAGVAGGGGESKDVEPEPAVQPMPVSVRGKRARGPESDTSSGGGEPVGDGSDTSSVTVIKKADAIMVVRIDGIDGGRIRMVVKDGVRYLSARDIIKFQCQKNNKQVLQAWGRLNKELKEGLVEYMDLFTFAGSGEVDQPVLQARGALELVMSLEDAPAERNRVRMLAALAEVWTGDSGKLLEALRTVRERMKMSIACADRALTVLDGGTGAKRARRD
jgi:hypothetical protein